MGLQETFTALASLPDADAARYLDVALAEPHETLQARAVDFILSTNRPERLAVLVARFPALLPSARARTEASGGALLAAAEDAVKRGAPDQRQAAYQLMVALGELSTAPMLIGGLDDGASAVRQSVAEAFHDWLTDYQNRLLDFKAHRTADSEAFVRTHEHAALSVIRALLSRHDRYPDAAALRTAIEMGEPAYMMLLETVLERTDTEVYRAFVAAMLRAHSPEAMEILMRLAAERIPRFRNAAVDIFRKRDDDDISHDVAAFLMSRSDGARKALAQRMNEAPWWAAAVRARDLTGDEARTLVEFLDQVRIDAAEKTHLLADLRRHPVSAVRAEAFRALARGPDAVAQAVEALGDPDPLVQLPAARLLVERKAPNLARVLVRFVKSENADLAKLALRVVAEESFQRYMQTFDKLDEKTRQTAARAISKIDPSLFERLTHEIGSLDSERRLKALKIVEYAHVEDQLRPALMELLHDADVKVRATAIKTVQLSGSIEGIRVLIEALNDKDRRVRSNAIEAFEHIGDQRFTALLKPFLHDLDNRVRGNAAKAMFRLGQPEGRTTLETMLADIDPLMRMSAAWAMGELASLSFLPALRDRLSRESDEHVVRRITEAVAEIDREGRTLT